TPVEHRGCLTSRHLPTRPPCSLGRSIPDALSCSPLPQVLPDYLKGLFNILPSVRPSEQQFQQLAKLAALQHRAKDSVYLPSVREVQDYVPPQFYRMMKGQAWLNLVIQHMQQIQALSPHHARAQFLGKKPPGRGGACRTD
uniref:FERM central domain-containing protein n=1 Tax=Ornithorhynchus anatinus TaxID=9258 RepID=K7EG60_ORNAN